MSAHTTDDTDHMLPGPVDTDHQLPKGDVSSSSSLPSQEIPSSLPQTAPPDESAKHSHLVAATLAVLTFTAVVLLGWMIWTSPLLMGTKAQTQPGAQIAPVPVTDSPLRIGGIMPLTGDAASYGLPYKNAVQLAQKEINANGGIGGRQIVMEWEDGRCEGDAANVAAEKLVNEKQVQYLIAGACSSEYLAAAPIAQEKKVISFSGSATSPKISELGKYVFRTTPSDELAGKAAAAYAQESWQAKTAAVIWENSEYPQALRSVFMEEFTRLGGKISVDESFDTGTTDFSDIVAKLRKSPSDVIYILPQTPTPGILLVSAIQQVRIPSKLLTAEVLLIRDTVTKQGNLLEGVTGLELLFDETRPKTSAFFRGYKQEYGLEVNDPAYMTGFYDILYLIRQAHEATNGDPDAVSDYLYALKDWEGAIGKITFDTNGDPRLSFAIRTITKGEAMLVDQYTPESGE